MRVNDIRQASPSPAVMAGSEPAPALGESRALIALTPTTKAAATPTSYRQVPFLAHLLAVKD